MITLKQDNITDKADSLTDSLKEKLGISVLFKKVSLFGACGLLTFLIFLLRKIGKENLKINNEYLNAYTSVIRLINNHAWDFFKLFVVFSIAFLGLYWLAYCIANHFNSDVFWEPYPSKEKNMLKNLWNKILRSSIFYRKLDATGITYFTSMKYYSWYNKLRSAGKQIILFLLKIETIYYTFEYLNGADYLLLNIVIPSIWLTMFWDCYKLIFLTTGIPDKFTLYDIVYNLIIINRYNGECCIDFPSSHKEQGIYIIGKVNEFSTLYYLIFISEEKPSYSVPSFKEKFEYLEKYGKEKYENKYANENVFALYPTQPIICYSDSYTELLTYVKYSNVLHGEVKKYPLKI